VSAFPLNPVRLRQLLGKEFRQTLRDPRAKPVLFIAPIIQLLIFGYAVTTDVRNTRTFVVDRDRSSESRALLGALTASGYFRVTGVGGRPADLTQALDHGDALLGVEIPRGFAADLGAGRQTSVQLLVDGSTANTANVALGYATRIISSYGLQQGAAAAARAGAAIPPVGVDLRARAWYNPNLESRVYNVPGVIGLIVMLMSLMLTALAVVREREVGTLEQLMVSPLKPIEMIVGKTLPSVLVAFLDLTLVTTVALLWFGIPFRGTVLLLVTSSVLYILCGLGVGLLISTISKTQQEAFMSVFLFLFPAMILSGLMFPVENMPLAIQYFTLLDPIRHFLIIVRGVFLRGAGWSILYPQILTLLVMGVGVLGFAATRFRKTIA
jgi:ABC-2 type transport system permease protein